MTLLDPPLLCGITNDTALRAIRIASRPSDPSAPNAKSRQVVAVPSKADARVHDDGRDGKAHLEMVHLATRAQFAPLEIMLS
jgi:hypothetical protein